MIHTQLDSNNSITWSVLANANPYQATALPVDQVVIVVTLHLVFDRRLQVTDPLERQLQISLQTLIRRLQTLHVHFLSSMRDGSLVNDLGFVRSCISCSGLTSCCFLRLASPSFLLSSDISSWTSRKRL